MALKARQTIAQRQADIDSMLTAAPASITYLVHRELLHQDMINSQHAQGYLTLLGTKPTMTLNSTTYTLVEISSGVDGAVDSAPSLFDSSIEIDASEVTHDLTFNLNCIAEFSGSIMIIPTAGGARQVTTEIFYYSAQADATFPLGFAIESKQEKDAGTMLTIPTFPLRMYPGDKMWLGAKVATGADILCDVIQGFLSARVLPYGI